MGVSKDDTLKPAAVFENITNVWNDQVYSQEFFFGEGLATIDSEQIIAVLKEHHVHANFAHTAQGYDL